MWKLTLYFPPLVKGGLNTCFSDIFAGHNINRRYTLPAWGAGERWM
jgi:hypothetical protein